MVGSQLIKSHRLEVKLLHTPPFFKDHSQVELRLRQPLVGGFAEPLGSLGWVGVQALALGEHAGEIKLRLRMPLLGGAFEPHRGLHLMPAIVKLVGQFKLRLSIPPRGLAGHRVGGGGMRGRENNGWIVRDGFRTSTSRHQNHQKKANLSPIHGEYATTPPCARASAPSSLLPARG